MILLIIGIVLACLFLIWLWKGPVRKFVDSMKKNGSSAFEAYTILLLIISGGAFAVYMIMAVI